MVTGNRTQGIVGAGGCPVAVAQYQNADSSSQLGGLGLIPPGQVAFTFIYFCPIASNEPLFPAEIRSEMKSEVKPSKL